MDLRGWLDWLRTHRRVALVVGGATLVALGWWLSPSPPPPSAPKPPSPFPGVIPDQATVQGALAALQQEQERLKQTVAAQQETIRELKAARAEQVERTLKRALETPAPPPLPLPAPPAQETASLQPEPPRLQVIRLDPPPQGTASPPAPRPHWVRLPAGSFVRARLLTGVYATQAGQALPALFVAREAFAGPNQTGIPLQGCLLIGKAQADLTSLRALVQVVTLSCVLPDGSAFEREVAGYIAGRDGTLGIPGRLEQRTGRYLATTFLSSFIAGAAEAFARAEQTIGVTPLGGTTTTVTGDVGKFAAFSGLSTAAAQLAQFYMDQARLLLPVVWVESGKEVYVVMQQGVTIEGLPATGFLPRPPGLD